MSDTFADSWHTAWFDPGAQRARLRELPAAPGALADALELFLVHHAAARARGWGVPAAPEGDRALRRAALLLEAAVERDGRPLDARREIGDYLYGTCHDFALLSASALRERGVAARLRVGFADYFGTGRWEDHWVCEFRIDGRWAVLDAQLGATVRRRLGIGFDVADVPASGWRTAAAIWRAVRGGEVTAEDCGVSFVGIAGAWFVAASVLRDAAALAGIEALPWDYWGIGRDICTARAVTEAQAAAIDGLAAALEPAPVDRVAAAAVLDRFAWARPGATVLSFPRDHAEEIAL